MESVAVFPVPDCALESHKAEFARIQLVHLILLQTFKKLTQIYGGF